MYKVDKKWTICLKHFRSVKIAHVMLFVILFQIFFDTLYGYHAKRRMLHVRNPFM